MWTTVIAILSIVSSKYCFMVLKYSINRSTRKIKKKYLGSQV
jgi:hypothetical protein